MWLEPDTCFGKCMPQNLAVSIKFVEYGGKMPYHPFSLRVLDIMLTSIASPTYEYVA